MALQELNAVALQELNLVAPSGNRVRVDLPAETPVSSVAAAIRFVGGSFGTGFQIGPRGYHDFACTRVAPATTRQRLLVHGREVVVAEANDGSSSVATLFGDYHELMTVYIGPAPPADRVLALFGSLEIADEAAGMTVRPVSATLLDSMAEHLFVVVRGRGSLSIPGPRQAAALVPAHAGAPTRFGEVWKATHPSPAGSNGSGDHFFILGCPAGAAEVHLSGSVTGTAGSVTGTASSTTGTAGSALDWLDSINVTWQADR